MQQNAFQIVKSTLAAIVFALAFVLVFTLIIQIFSVAPTAVKPVNQVFKILAIAFGGMIFIKGEKGLVKGVIHGLCAVILTFFLFSLISGSFAMSWTFIFELLLGAGAGAVTGIIAVNVKKQ